MKLNIKNISLFSLLCLSGAALTSCEDFLDRQPITSVTPEAYFTTASQVGAYVNNYYNDYLQNSQGQSLFHSTSWNAGIANNDQYTDNFVEGDVANGSNLAYFNGQWESSAGQNLITDYGRIRVWNYLITTIEPKLESIQDDDGNLTHYLGEAYFFRAMAYYNALVKFGDLPIITEVLPNEEGYLQENSVRAPRNEVARFILSDLDKAIERLNNAGFQNNQRINKQTAQLFKSRVALFEGTFEKYHQGTGRVPGDANWPGGTFEGNIQDEINFFFDQAMAAASAVADYSGLTLTENSHVINPEYGEIYGWNPYFEMFSQPSLSSVPEVLFWKEYNKSLSISHDAPNRLKVGDNDGITRSFITSFLMKDGLPFYASSNYQGDETLDKEFANRDERLQLFVWAESTVLKSDPTEQGIAESGEVELFEKPLITNSATQNLDRTGYRQRKHYTYDYTQSTSDELLGTNACPIFRVAEAYLNYIEACYERTGQIDTKADGYWRALRRRAGVDEDYNKTIAATDINKELELQDLSAWSGDGPVDATIFNIRRERRCEFIGEGMRWDDLKRWRSWDRLFEHPYIPEGFNLWDQAYQNYTAETAGTGNGVLVADGTTNANASPESVSKYLRPYQRTQTNNDLYDGYTWMKAYYLTPIGIQELTLAPQMYQNPYWSSETAGLALE